MPDKLALNPLSFHACSASKYARRAVALILLHTILFAMASCMLCCPERAGHATSHINKNDAQQIFQQSTSCLAKTSTQTTARVWLNRHGPQQKSSIAIAVASTADEIRHSQHEVRTSVSSSQHCPAAKSAGHHNVSFLTFCIALTLSGRTGFFVGLAAALAGLDFTSSASSLPLPTSPIHCSTFINQLDRQQHQLHS